MIYVDRLQDRGWFFRGKQTKSCHLAADTLEELHACAKRLGLLREWFQCLPYPHYDLTPAKRTLAVKLGAKELSNRRFVQSIRKEKR